MKTFLSFFIAAIAAFNAFSQGAGSVNIAQPPVPPEDRIYVVDDPATPYMQGTLAGSAYSYAVYWSLPGANQWTQLGAANNFSDTAPGQLAAGNRTITGLPEDGAVVDMHVRAWERAFGATYDAVLATGNPAAHAGRSIVLTLKTKDPNDLLEPTPTLTSDPGWVGFALTPVPEPSAIALALLAAGALLISRRRN